MCLDENRMMFGRIWIRAEDDSISPIRTHFSFPLLVTEMEERNLEEENSYIQLRFRLALVKYECFI